MRQYNPAIPVLDNHCHVCFPQPIDESLHAYEVLFRELSIHEASLLSCPASSHNEGGMDILENLKMLYLKERLSIPCFAFAGFTWHWTEPERYEAFAKEMLPMGFDGFKALEMHPRVRRLNSKGLCDPSFADFFRYADEQGSVMVCHVGDPRFNWDLDTASPDAVKLGRVYGEGFLTLDELYAETEAVLSQHRNMRFILAHFYFMSDDHDRLCRLLEDHPHVYLDLTPGGEMYVNFTRDPEKWRAFFTRYASRIILGSDHYAVGSGEVRYDLARNFLEGTEPFAYFGQVIQPLCLPREILDQIYWKNIHRLLGDTPKPVNRRLAYEHCLWIEENCYGQLTQQGRENLAVMTAYWKP